MRFANPLQYWSTDERIAYADGYDESTATLFELLDLSDWVCDSDQAWREARFHWAQGVLRAWTYELQCDVENLVAQRGDRVEVMTDVLEIGITTGESRPYPAPPSPRMRSSPSTERSPTAYCCARRTSLSPW